jgi:hypothetical protein
VNLQKGNRFELPYRGQVKTLGIFLFNNLEHPMVQQTHVAKSFAYID